MCCVHVHLHIQCHIMWLGLGVLSHFAAAAFPGSFATNYMYRMG